MYAMVRIFELFFGRPGEPRSQKGMIMRGIPFKNSAIITSYRKMKLLLTLFIVKFLAHINIY